MSKKQNEERVARLVHVAGDDNGELNWRGQTYEAEDGVYTVPEEALSDLRDHGYELAPPAKKVLTAAEQKELDAAKGKK